MGFVFSGFINICNIICNLQSLSSGSPKNLTYSKDWSIVLDALKLDFRKKKRKNTFLSKINLFAVYNYCFNKSYFILTNIA